VGLEAILGFTKRGDSLVIDPRVPAAWPIRDRVSIPLVDDGAIHTVLVTVPARESAQGPIAFPAARPRSAPAPRRKAT
jgi:cellobiose phosphorylase